MSRSGTHSGRFGGGLLDHDIALPIEPQMNKINNNRMSTDLLKTTVYYSERTESNVISTSQSCQ